MKKYEYDTETFSIEPTDRKRILDTLNKRGVEGWRVVGHIGGGMNKQTFLIEKELKDCIPTSGKLPTSR